MEIIIVIISICSIGFIAFVFWFILSSFSNKNVNNDPHLDLEHINQESFQRFAKFYGEIFPNDDRFDIKLYRIYTFIHDKGMRDIKKISELSLCELPETVMKIKYLKNKRLIDDLYIDTNNMMLINCSLEDQQLLDKYKPYIYASHKQIDEIASTIPNNCSNINDLKDKIFNEILYLYKKGLINGIKINEVDRDIIYYSVEKKKNTTNLSTVHCSNCGALNDVDVNGKVRCSYCGTIIIGRDFK